MEAFLMLGKLSIHFSMGLFAMVFLTACGQQNKDFEEEARIERITALIDSRGYDSIINWYERSKQSDQKKYARFYALAKLGKGGFNPIEMIPKILAPQTFQSYERAKLFGNCSNQKLESFDKPEVRCLVVRMMNQLPNPNNRYLIEAKQILSDMAQNGELSSADYTLLLIVETALIVKRVGNVLEAYMRLGDNITDQQLHFFYAEIEKATMASESWIENMERSPEDVSKRVTGLSKVSILKDVRGQTRFIKETGIPYVLENIKTDNRNAVAVVSRMFFIQIIDTVLRDYFQVQEEQSAR
jgi:hypothetical protein